MNASDTPSEPLPELSPSAPSPTVPDSSAPPSGPSLAGLLRGCTFFDPFSDQQVTGVAAIAQTVDVPAEHRIFREGDAADDVYVILSGRVVLEIRDGAERKQVCTLDGGELLGWSAALGNVRYTATARTLEPTRLARLGTRALQDLCQGDLAFGYAFATRTSRSLATRLSAARLQLIDVHGPRMPAAADDLLEPPRPEGTASP